MLSYGTFVETRSEVWREAASMLALMETRPLREQPLELVEQFITLYRACLADYSHLQTHFPGTRALDEVADLVVRGSYHLNPPRKSLIPSLIHFFKVEYPAAVRRCAPAISAAFLIFFFSTLWGFVLTMVKPEFAELFLGPDIHGQLSEGRLWVDGITRAIPPEILSAGIWVNNSMVALFSWAGGALWGIGTLCILLQNGIMLGSVLELTAQYGLSGRLIAFILGHGVLEITLLIIVCGAGLQLGYAMVNPRGYPFRSHLAHHGRESFTVAAGSLPWFLLLGVVEGVFSPRLDIPVSIHALVGFTVFTIYCVLILMGGRDAG